MMEFQPIYTERDNCQDCYKCVRNCPVKSIKIQDHKALIISEQCVMCGICYDVCPSKAKKVRSDIHDIQYLLTNYQNVIVSLAPSFYTEFSEYSKSEIISLFKSLGFSEVSETAIGADIVSKYTAEYIQNNEPKVYVSSACPSVVEMIEKYYPDYSHSVVPVFSPMIAHGKWLKQKYGKDTKVVFVGPCIAKKMEMNVYPGYIDAAITFSELSEWLIRDGVQCDSSANYGFFPFEANRGAIYPIDGGMIDTLKSHAPLIDVSYMSFSGTKSIINILDGLQNLKLTKSLFLELLMCEGGCVNGLGMGNKNSTAQRRIDIIKNSPSQNGEESYVDDDIDVYNDLKPYVPVVSLHYEESQVFDTLQSIGKHGDEDYLNCGGCGYSSCRSFAIALLDEKSDKSMCVSYMRNVAQNKASVLLQKMPYGVVIVDENMRVIESNRKFAQLIGDEVESVYDIKPGLHGSVLERLVPFSKLFENYLNSGLDEYQKDIRYNNRILHISLFSIQKNKIVCGIINDIKTSELKKDEVVVRSREVIRKNLETVQKIAFLLGENAAQTEGILNSIVESYSDDKE